MQALPSLSEPRLVFMGASPSGKGAIFSLVTEAIVHGSGTCLPSASQCEGIDLRAGKSEELDYLEASGQTTVYTLTVQSIAKRGTNAVVARRAAHEAVVARRRLQQDGHSLAGLGLRYSIEKGLLLWGSHRSAPAHHAAPKAPVLSDDLG
jgi:hypothetical protein